MALTGHPPHRFVREELPHTALASGRTVSRLATHLPYVIQTKRHPNPAMCPGGGRLNAVPLGRSPFLHGLRHPSSGLVRPLPRYYEIVRLPEDVPVDCLADALSDRSLPPHGTTVWADSYGGESCFGRGDLRGLPVPVLKGSTHAQGLRLRRVARRLATERRRACGLPHVRTRSARGSGDFGGQYLACVYPCPSNTRDVTIAGAGLGAEAVGYSFLVWLFHPHPSAGLSRRFP